MEAFGEIEYYIRYAGIELFNYVGDVVEYRECLDVVAETQKRLHYVSFGGSLLLLQPLGGEGLVRVQPVCEVEQDKNLHPYTDLLNLPV